MLQITIALLYITLLCWTYGYGTIAIFRKLAAAKQAHVIKFSITCITGLSTIAVIAAICSLFVPLGGWLVQLLLLLAGGLSWTFNKQIRPDFINPIRESLKTYNRPVLLLLASFVLLMFVMGSWTIIHPDTLGYHAQTIQWIESYKAIPGLAHIHIRYGLQSYWYILCALFSFRFTHTESLTFINTCLACWFLLFVTGMINDALQSKKDDVKKLVTGVLFFFLLALSFWDFGQLRLTAVSASPDFAAAMYLWLVFYLLTDTSNEKEHVVQLMLVFFFSITAITIKLSSAPVLLVSCYILYRLALLNGKKVFGCLVVFAFLAVIPFVTRNLITSGYAVFPLTFPHIAYADWKLDEIRAEHVRHYVTAYARTGSLANMGIPQPDIENNWIKWLPLWWSNRSMAEKTMLVALLGSFFSGLICIKKIFSRCTIEQRAGLSVSAAGIIFWFVQAPDPRFGYGFIIPFMGTLLYMLLTGYSLKPGIVKRTLLSGVFTLCIITAGYTAYRFHHFFHMHELIQPEGIAPVAYRNVQVQGIIFHVPYGDCNCGSTPLPCAYYNEPFLMRGKALTDGFKSAKQPVK